MCDAQILSGLAVFKAIKELDSSSMFSLVAGGSAGQSANLCVNLPSFPTAKLSPDL